MIHHILTKNPASGPSHSQLSPRSIRRPHSGELRFTSRMRHLCTVFHICLYHRYAGSPNTFSTCLQGVPFTVTLSMTAANFLCDKDFVLRDVIKGTIYITDYLTFRLLICPRDERCRIHRIVGKNISDYTVSYSRIIRRLIIVISVKQLATKLPRLT